MPSPAQRRAEDLITASMRAGLYDGSSKLSEFHLVKSLSTSRNAVRSALRSLADQGMFRRSPRSGTVATGYWQLREFSEVGLPDDSVGKIGYKILDVDRVVAPELVRQVFALKPDEEVHLIETMRCLGKVRIGVGTTYLPIWEGWEPMAQFKLLTDTLREGRGRGLPPVAEGDLSPNEADRPFDPSMEFFPVGDVTFTMGATRCDPATAELLGIVDGAPLLWEQVTTRDKRGEPIMMGFARHNPYHLSVSERLVW